jgi:hypothetical protein
VAESKTPLAQPGSWCQPDVRKGDRQLPPQVVTAPADDAELQLVYGWLAEQPVAAAMRTAVDDAVKYVLDGARTWRFDLLDPKVDSDERASVGTKLQYHIIEQLSLKKEPPLDTSIVGIAVEIKGTVRRTWMIPREGQCQVTLLVRINPRMRQFEAWLMRTHRAWLTEGGNQDKKRSPIARAVAEFALRVVERSDLPDEPLRRLTFEQKSLVFGPNGLRQRAVALFSVLPNVVIPRSSLLTVGAGLHDPMKRFREAKAELRDAGLVVLVGTWAHEAAIARQLGHDLSGDAWVAVPTEAFASAGIEVPEGRA